MQFYAACRSFDSGIHTMHQIQAHRYGPPEVLEWATISPPEIESRELLVEVKCASTGMKDVLVRKGKIKAHFSLHFPLTFGQNFSGIVSKVGAQAGPFLPGDRVFGMVNQSSNGTLSEFLKVTPRELYYAPENLSFAEAAAIPQGALTALQALVDNAKVSPGQRVLINGASGSTGTFAIQIAKILGAHVTAIADAESYTLCRSLGADRVLDEQRHSIASLQGTYDAFFDVNGELCSGKVRHLLTKTGWYLTTASNTWNLWETFLSLFKIKRSSLVVVEAHSEDLRQLKAWSEAGLLHPVIEAEFPLRKIVEAHRYIEERQTRGNVIVKISR